MSERQAAYAPPDGDEDGVRVNVQVQAPSEEIEDLVAVIVGRLEDAGLALVERSALAGGGVALVLRRVAWLG